MDARTYGIGARRDCQAWIDWTLGVTREAVRVSRGLVIWICAGVTRKWVYQPGCEGLLYEWWKQGGRCWRPAFWHRVGIPGSGGKQWLRADIEYALCFTKCEASIPWADATANGHPPKWAPGGEMSHRISDGTRTNQWGKTGSMTGTTATVNTEKATVGKARPSHVSGSKQVTRRASSGHGPNGDARQDDVNLPPVLANPGVLIKGIKVGGGLMGNDLAHENEAPFPVKLAQWFIRGWCPPGGKVLDVFLGSGTTCDAAQSLGRNSVGCDIRFSQLELSRRRCAEIQPTLFQ